MTYYQQHQADFLEGLKTFLRIPSISTLSEHKPDIRRARWPRSARAWWPISGFLNPSRRCERR